jgi:hypothetical protein
MSHTVQVGRVSERTFQSMGRVSIDRSMVAALLSTTPRLVSKSSTDGPVHECLQSSSELEQQREAQLPLSDAKNP